jgi:hypothetical protein
MRGQVVHVEPHAVGPVERHAEIEVRISHFTPGIQPAFGREYRPRESLPVLL